LHSNTCPLPVPKQTPLVEMAVKYNKIVKYCTAIHVPYQSLNRIICDKMGAVCGAAYAYPCGALGMVDGVQPYSPLQFHW